MLLAVFSKHSEEERGASWMGFAPLFRVPWRTMISLALIVCNRNGYNESSYLRDAVAAATKLPSKLNKLLLSNKIEPFVRDMKKELRGKALPCLLPPLPHEQAGVVGALLE